jgi:hypothetical protein
VPPAGSYIVVPTTRFGFAAAGAEGAGVAVCAARGVAINALKATVINNFIGYSPSFVAIIITYVHQDAA